MCSIAGIFDPKGVTSRDIDLVRAMNDIQRHRGPDDEGLYHDANCVLGHRRLAIIDLSIDGRQPFVSNDNRYRMIYNGEIYNYIELKEKLQNTGLKFKTKTDTEVLLSAYAEYKEKALPLLNGMFAFAVYDVENKSLFMARDRFGIKPFYYSIVGPRLYFASEIKALLAALPEPFSINYQSLFDYLVFNRTDIHDETFISEIKRLPKGCWATFVNGRLEIKKWWDPNEFIIKDQNPDMEKTAETINELFLSSVSFRMRSDVPIGTCLSGGLDSSILYGAAYNMNKKEPYPSFTAAFPGDKLDETRFVDALGKRYPLTNHRVFPTSTTAADQLKQFVFNSDEPTTNPSFFSQYEVMRLAKEKGVTVLLDGQGGDEIFAGYQYFHGFYMHGLLNRNSYLSFLKEFFYSLLRNQDISGFQTLLFQELPDFARKKLLLKKLPYIKPDFFHEYMAKSLIYNEFFNAQGLNDSIVKHFQYKLEHLLRMEDRNSMAFSLEARMPYLDHRLVEYLLSVPEEMKIHHGQTKYLQKKALGKYTVYEILNRKDKIGFGTPGKKWMATNEWREMTSKNYEFLAETFPEVFNKEAALPVKGYDRWKVNQLGVWKRLFL